MTFHISQELLFERAIVVSATILLFGLVSIGGLSLWRRFAMKRSLELPTSETPKTMGRTETETAEEYLNRLIKEKTEEMVSRESSRQDVIRIGG